MSVLNTLSKKIHDANVKKGFYDNPREIGTLLMLVVSELSEALEADRKNRHCKEQVDSTLDDNYIELFEQKVKDTFEDEIADALIRLFDLVGYLNIDIDAHIDMKLRYNATRPHKHGKNY